MHLYELAPKPDERVLIGVNPRKDWARVVAAGVRLCQADQVLNETAPHGFNPKPPNKITTIERPTRDRYADY